jgi:hypothetical protein
MFWPVIMRDRLLIPPAPFQTLIRRAMPRYLANKLASLGC